MEKRLPAAVQQSDEPFDLTVYSFEAPIASGVSSKPNAHRVVCASALTGPFESFDVNIPAGLLVMLSLHAKGRTNDAPRRSSCSGLDRRARGGRERIAQAAWTRVDRSKNWKPCIAPTNTRRAGRTPTLPTLCSHRHGRLPPLPRALCSQPQSSLISNRTRSAYPGSNHRSSHTRRRNSSRRNLYRHSLHRRFR